MKLIIALVLILILLTLIGAEAQTKDSTAWTSTLTETSIVPAVKLDTINNSFGPYKLQILLQGYTIQYLSIEDTTKRNTRYRDFFVSRYYVLVYKPHAYIYQGSGWKK